MESLDEILARAKARPVRSCDECGADAYDRLCLDCMNKKANERETKAEQRAAHEQALAATPTTIPPYYESASFEAADLKKKWVRNHGAIGLALAAVDAQRVMLVGPPGAGKTVLAIAMLRERARRRGQRGMFVDSYELAAARARHALGEGEALVVQQAMREPVLAIDDVGGEPVTTLSSVAEVIFRRHANMLPYIVTTGFSREELRAKYGSGIVRRLFEGATIIDCTPAKLQVVA